MFFYNLNKIQRLSQALYYGSHGKFILNFYHELFFIIFIINVSHAFIGLKYAFLFQFRNLHWDVGDGVGVGVKFKVVDGVKELFNHNQLIIPKHLQYFQIFHNCFLFKIHLKIVFLLKFFIIKELQLFIIKLELA